MKRVLLICLALTLSLVACGGDDKTPSASGPSKVTVKTSEYTFDVPATFAGGLLELTIDNSAGKESHEASMTRLDTGKTLADFQAATQAGPPPTWAHHDGGPGPVLPGKTAVYTGNFQAGTYIFVCHVPAPDGKEHRDKGMIRQVEVSSGTTGTVPAGDVSIEMTEMKFVGTEGLKAGTQTVRVRNTGKQVHFAAVVVMAPGKKLADVGAFFAAEASGKPPAGPPPFTGFAGLVAEMDPGVDGARTLELQAGTTYVFVCFIPDTDGKPHFAKGMAAEITPS